MFPRNVRLAPCLGFESAHWNTVESDADELELESRWVILPPPSEGAGVTGWDALGLTDRVPLAVFSHVHSLHESRGQQGH